MHLNVIVIPPPSPPSPPNPPPLPPPIGVHLNVIEAAADPAFESWRNINAIDDVVKATFSMSTKLVVSALQVGEGGEEEGSDGGREGEW